MCSFWILFLQHTTWEASQLFFFPNGASLKGDVSQADHSWTRVCKEETSHPVWTQPWPTHERCLPFNSTWLCFCSDPSLTWNQTHRSSPVSPRAWLDVYVCVSHTISTMSDCETARCLAYICPEAVSHSPTTQVLTPFLRGGWNIG